MPLKSASLREWQWPNLVLPSRWKLGSISCAILCCSVQTGFVINIEALFWWKMTHWWFSQLETFIYHGCSMAMLNEQRLRVNSTDLHRQQLQLRRCIVTWPEAMNPCVSCVRSTRGSKTIFGNLITEIKMEYAVHVYTYLCIYITLWYCENMCTTW